MKLLSAFLVGLCGVAAIPDSLPFTGDEGCTSVVLGKDATTAGGPIVSYADDCNSCDPRLMKVPAQDHAPGSKRPIYLDRMEYPRFVGDNRGEGYKIEHVDRSIYPWNNTEAMGYIDEVEHTYAYLDGGYGMINEHQLAFGESTCGSKLINKPIAAGGKALMNIRELSRIALERTRTARDAIQLMGDLATTYGYYACVWEGDMAMGEAGESLSVADTEEAWMFHILPDGLDTGAVWVAQRVRSNAVAAIGNQFVIQEIDLEDTENFMGSDNIYDIALANGFWDPERDGPFNFVQAYAMPRTHHVYATRRVWRVFQKFAPSFTLSPHTDPLARSYPFDIPVDEPVGVEDVFAIMRDHYEGTEFDLTKGIAGGPYGDPSRFDPAAYGDVSDADTLHGSYERAIAMYRTSYTTITQSRGDLPDEVGAVVWFGLGSAESSLYAPVYVSVDEIPEPYATGNLYKYDESSMFWVSTVVANWAKRFYKYAIVDIQATQQEFEGDLLAQQASIEQAAAESDDPVKFISDYSKEAMMQAYDVWYNFMYHQIAKFHDGYRIDDFHAEQIVPTKLFYPHWWLKVTGYFNSSPGAGQGMFTELMPESVDSGTAAVVTAMSCVVAVCGGVLLSKRWYHRRSHSTLSTAAV